MDGGCNGEAVNTCKFLGQRLQCGEGLTSKGAKKSGMWMRALGVRELRLAGMEHERLTEKLLKEHMT